MAVDWSNEAGPQRELPARALKVSASSDRPGPAESSLSSAPAPTSTSADYYCEKLWEARAQIRMLERYIAEILRA